MIDIVDYTDYRAFLREFFEEKKRTSPFLSFRYLGSRLNIDPSQLLKIVQGQLHLSRAKVESVIQYCKLNSKESEYFRLLVGYNKAKNAAEARMYFDKLAAISGVHFTELEKDQYSFFTRWYYSAIWCALNVFDCDDNYEELGLFVLPAIEPSQVRESLDLLKRLQLIKKNDQGFWKSTDQNISTGESWRTLAVRQHQQEMIRIAGESLDRVAPGERDVSSVTLGVSEESLAEMRAVTEEYRRNMIRISNQSEPTDRVYQLNVQLFPLTTRGDQL